MKAEILKNTYFYLNATHNQTYCQLQEPQLYVEGVAISIREGIDIDKQKPIISSKRLHIMRAFFFDLIA